MNLKKLAAGIETYRLLYEKRPAKLSELYYEGIVDDLRTFVCPASGTRSVLQTEIDTKGDYLLGEVGKDLVRERGAFHTPGQAFAIFPDGTISAVTDSAPASTAPAVASPARTVEPTVTVAPAPTQQSPVPPETTAPNPTTSSAASALPRRKLTVKQQIAAERGDTAEVRALVSGSEPNARDELFRRTALTWSIYLNDRAAFERFIAAGADVNAADDRGATPLFAAAELAMQFDTSVMAETLVAKGAGRDGGVPRLGLTPLMHAANSNAPGVVRAILSKLDPTHIDARTSDGKTALIVAATVGAADIVRMLLDKGAKVDGADGTGATPLIYAAGYAFPGTTATVSLLLSKGAEPNARDQSGHTPLSRAKQYGPQEVVEILRRAGAQ